MGHSGESIVSSAFQFERLAPASAGYASLPVDAAFNWAECASPAATGEWYMVAFRSVMRPSADEDRLREYDDRAYEEARTAPGFVHYFKGPANDLGQCLSFCLWDSRQLARSAAGRPAHLDALGIAHATYERYTLEFFRVRKRGGWLTFEFEPYDRPDADAAA